MENLPVMTLLALCAFASGESEVDFRSSSLTNSNIRPNYYQTPEVERVIKLSSEYFISSYSFRGNYSFLKVENVEIFI